MWKRLIGIGAIVLVLTLPVPGADKKKDKKDGPAVDPNLIDADKIPAGEYVGKLLSVPSPQGSFTVEIEIKHLELKNPGQAAHQANTPVHKPQVKINTGNAALNNLSQDMQNIANIQGQLANAKNPKDAGNFQRQLLNAMNQFERDMAQAQQQAAQAVLQAQQQVLQAQQQAELQILRQLQQQNQQLLNSIKVVTEKKKVEFHCGDEVVVRNQSLPLEYDDKGQPKKYTAEEIKKLKGPNPNTPGYEAKLEDLQAGAVVKVVLALIPKPKKDAEKKDAEKKDAEKKDAEKKDAAGGLVENKDLVHRTVVKMVLIISTDDVTDTGSMADKKGKK